MQVGMIPSLSSDNTNMGSDWLVTDNGNVVSRRAVIHGSSSIVLAGKGVINESLIRGDLRRAGGSNNNAVVIQMGRYSIVGKGAVIRPPYKTYRGWVPSHAFIRWFEEADGCWQYSVFR